MQGIIGAIRSGVMSLGNFNGTIKGKTTAEPNLQWIWVATGCVTGIHVASKSQQKANWIWQRRSGLLYLYLTKF